MTSQSFFEGWVAQDETSISGNMRWMTYEPKPFEETDIEIKVSYCGVCASDLAHLRSGWKLADYPIVVGHEIVGHVVRVGDAVKDYNIGDREQYCKNEFVTYDARFSDGNKSYGGFARHWRGSGSFAFRIPESIPSEVAALMLCGGLTVYSPLILNGAGPGKRIGVVGRGGLGHFAVLFAKALKCEKVVAISRSSSKRADALKMGADEYIATAEELDWATKHADSLDLIISTISGAGFDLEKYLSLLDIHGTLI